MPACGAALPQASALCHLPRFLAVLVNLAGRGWCVDGSSTAHWPADASGGLQTLQALVSGGMQPPLPPQQQQQQLSLPFLSELLLAVVQQLSGADELSPAETELLQLITGMLAARGGLMPGAAVATSGYSSPGLLHLLLGTHVRLLLDGAADKPGAPLAQHRAVNALHLTRRLLLQQGVLQGFGQRLLLPCLLQPLVRLLTAKPGGCGAAQYQVYQLLAPLLCGPAAAELQLLPASAGDGFLSLAATGLRPE
jgi:hypothetical protein